MSARATISVVSSHTFAVALADATLTNSGSRTAGGLENLGTQTSNTFTMTETMTVIESVNVPPNTPVAVPPPFDGLETTAGPYMMVKSISIPSSYNNESLSHTITVPSEKNPTNFTIFPDVKFSVTPGSFVGSAGVGTHTATGTITGPVKEMDDWVAPWNDPDASIPKFDGTDFATTRSSGYGREVGIFFVEFVIEYGLLDNWTTSPSPGTNSWPGTPVEKTYKIGIINNSDNDRDVYLQKYDEAYGSLSKVPELSERAS